MSPSVVAWAILFVLFWAVMWIYVFGSSVAEYRGLPWYGELVKSYVATAYSSLAMISLGSIAATLTAGAAAAAPAVRYVTRFTRLTAARLVAEDTAADLAVQAVAIAVVMVSTLLLAWQRYGVAAPPSRPLELLAVMVLLGLYYHLLSTVLAYAILAAGAGRMIQKTLAMLPLALSFIPYGLVFVDIGNSPAYIYPPIGLQALMIWAAGGKPVPATGIIAWMHRYYISSQPGQTVDPALALASTAAWLATLYLVAARLSKAVKAVKPEEVALEQ